MLKSTFPQLYLKNTGLLQLPRTRFVVYSHISCIMNERTTWGKVGLVKKDKTQIFELSGKGLVFKSSVYRYF